MSIFHLRCWRDSGSSTGSTAHTTGVGKLSLAQFDGIWWSKCAQKQMPALVFSVHYSSTAASEGTLFSDNLAWAVSCNHNASEVPALRGHPGMPPRDPAQPREGPRTGGAWRTWALSWKRSPGTAGTAGQHCCQRWKPSTREQRGSSSSRDHRPYWSGSRARGRIKGIFVVCIALIRTVITSITASHCGSTAKHLSFFL